VLLAAARRFVVLLALLGGGTVVVAALAGAITGASLDRAVSLGLYATGSVLLLGGFLLGNRGPLRRVAAEDDAPLTVGRALRRADAEELRESVNLTAVLITLGLVLLLTGVAIDSRIELV
jgi:hypothetical protein